MLKRILHSPRTLQNIHQQFLQILITHKINLTGYLIFSSHNTK